MTKRRTTTILITLAIAAAWPHTTGAQSLGTFAWQLQPFCNVVTLTVTPDGPAFRLTGYDDQCGGARVPAAGVVTPNGDGTFTLAFYLVAPQGLAAHTSARLAPPTYSGPWADDGGLTGTLTFGPSSSGGAPRPIAAFQQRVTGTCPAGEFVQKVREDGSVECGAAGGGGGVTGVTAGAGLMGGGSAGDVTLAVAPGGIGSMQIANGSIAAIDVNVGQIQRRVQGTCNDGLHMMGISIDGPPACWAGSSANLSVALGHGALAASTGGENTAIGAGALIQNSTGFGNTAVGASAMWQNTTGNANTAIGRDSLSRNTTGSSNLAIGDHVLTANTSGIRNTAIGSLALESNTTGQGNIAIGRSAGANLTTGNNNIAVGHQGTAGEADTIRIGTVQTRTFIAGISGRTTGVANAVAVLVDSSGQLGIVSSSRRAKEDVHDMGDASAGLFRLRPVTFRYLQPYADGSRPIDYGLIAEEVDEVFPDLVVRNDAGDIETVQYHKLTPMLLNELQRLRREIDAQRHAIEILRQRLAEREPAVR